MAKAKLGTKRTCTSCGLRYYDLNKTPIICPRCMVEFDSESLFKTRKLRQRTKASKDDLELSNEVETAEGTPTDLDQNTSNVSSSDNDAMPSDLDYDNHDGDVDEETGGLIQDDISSDDELLSHIPDSEDR